MKRFIFYMCIVFCSIGLQAQSSVEQINMSYKQRIEDLENKLSECKKSLQKAYVELEQMTNVSSIESQKKWIEILQNDIASFQKQITDTHYLWKQEIANAVRIENEIEKKVKEAQRKRRATQEKLVREKAEAQRRATNNAMKVENEKRRKAQEEENERKRVLRAEQKRQADEREAEARVTFRQNQGAAYQNMHSNVDENAHRHNELVESSKEYTQRQSNGYGTVKTLPNQSRDKKARQSMELKDIFNDSAKPKEKNRLKIEDPIDEFEYK